MNILRDRELARRFKDNAVPPRERFLYLLLLMVMMGAVSSAYFSNYVYAGGVNEWDTIIDVAVLVATVVGMVLCYRTNQSGDGREFVDRFVGIGFPVGIQAVLLTIALSVVYQIGLEVEGVETADQTSVHDLILITLTEVYFYWRLNSSIRLASR